MRNFIELDANSQLTINPQIYSIAVFKQIWDRDKTKEKDKAYLDIAYVFWACDYRSYIADITDPDLKKAEIISIITDGNYEPDELVNEAIEVYKRDRPLSLLFLNDVKCAINELRSYYRELDLREVDEKGKLIHDASKVQNSIKASGDLLDTLEKHETKVKKDIDMNNSTRGDQRKGLYED